MTFLLDLNPKNISSLIEYATTISIEGDFKNSIEYFERALQIEPNNITANLRLGKIYQQKENNNPKAINCFS